MVSLRKYFSAKAKTDEAKKEVSKDFLDRINPTNIQSVNVLKTAEEMLGFTNKKVAGIIIIQLKK